MRIAFVIEHPSARLLKIARALIEEGIEIEVFDLRSVPNYSGVMPKLKEVCLEWHEYFDSAQLYSLLTKTKASIIHFFALWGNCGNLCDILMINGSLPPIIVECYDILNEFYIDIDIYYPIYKARERYALAHADGAVFRSYCGDYIRNKGYKLPDSTLSFFDFFDNNTIMGEGITKTEEQLSFVYVGGISLKTEYPDSPHSCWEELALLCKENKCHLHIYPSTWDEDRFQPFFNIERNNQFFHLHMPLSSDDLIHEICQYDYGIMPATKELYDKENVGYYYNVTSMYAVSNKFFDYLCAGLPIIGYPGKKIMNDFSKDGMAFFLPIEEYDFEMFRRSVIKMKNNVHKNRHKYEIKYHIGRLIDYYKSLSV